MLGQPDHQELAGANGGGQVGTMKANAIGLTREPDVFEDVHGGMDQRRHVGFGSLRMRRSAALRSWFSSTARRGRDLPAASRPS